MRCRELDIFKIFGIFSEIVWKFFGILLQDFLEDFFGGIFWSNFLGKKKFWRILFFWEDFRKDFSREIIWEEFFVYIDLSRFCLYKEGRRARI